MKTIKEKIPSMIISLILASLGLGLKYLGVSDEKSILAATIILIVSFIISIKIYRPIRRLIILNFTKAEVEENGTDNKFLEFKENLSGIMGNSLKSDIAQNAGISGWYPSPDDAQNEISEYIKRSKSIKLITNTGKSDLSKGSKHYDAISKNKNTSVKILMSSADSPYISEKWAIKNGFSKEQSKIWVKRTKETIAELKYLNEHHKINLSVQSYSLPFTWHLWIFDENTVFVTAWLPQGQSTQKVRLYKITKNTNTSLFEMFDSYYERVWNEQSLKLL